VWSTSDATHHPCRVYQVQKKQPADLHYNFHLSTSELLWKAAFFYYYTINLILELGRREDETLVLFGYEFLSGCFGLFLVMDNSVSFGVYWEGRLCEVVIITNFLRFIYVGCMFLY
jgi:hypothetical protein